jgi:hypothetical protein
MPGDPLGHVDRAASITMNSVSGHFQPTISGWFNFDR